MLSGQNRISLSEFFNGEFSCEEVIKCLYNLNHLEFKVYCTLLHLNVSDVPKIITLIGGKDRTMVNRSLLTLISRDLCKREKKSKNGQRGYYYSYTPKTFDHLKADLISKIHRWQELVLLEVNKCIIDLNYLTNFTHK